MLLEEKLNVASPAQTALPTQLAPELIDFCLSLNITSAIRKFHDNKDEIHPNPCISNQSNQSSDIKEKSELKKFTQALQKAQSVMSRQHVLYGSYSQVSYCLSFWI